MSTPTSTSSSSGDKVQYWGAASTAVFIRDKKYAWLPAEILISVAKGDKTATVSVALPSDWDETTVEPQHKSLTHSSSSNSNSNSNRKKKDEEYRRDEEGRPVRIVRLADYPGMELPVQNVNRYDNGRILGKSDMTDLPNLHEAAILYNLKDRHRLAIPYTRVGDIVVAVNPFQWIEGMYSEEKRAYYADLLIWNARDEDYSNRDSILSGYFDKLNHDPHVYETSASAYHGLAVFGQDQAILVSGESGAGKTETVKIIMTHLSTVQQTRKDQPNDDNNNNQQHHTMDRLSIVNEVLESNPVFEAFGNAQTLRNDNSSRFGKFTKLHFDVQDRTIAEQQSRKVPICLLAGSHFDTYLLEKSRVISHDIRERTYHIFYHLLAAPDDFKAQVWNDGLKDATLDTFLYLGTPDVDVIEGRSDAQGWERSRASLELFGFRHDLLKSLMRALCIVLQIGNLTFSPDPSDDERTLIVSDTNRELEKLSDITGIPMDDIQRAITTRRLRARGEDILVKLSPSASKDSADALAKEIYAQIFDVVVRAINDCTAPPHVLHAVNTSSKSPSTNSNNKDSSNNGLGCISLLDLFGFETFETNRFEQLCINYANERLQYKYVLDNFLSAQNEYEEEGIELYNFSDVDNSNVLDMLEGRNMGLLAVLEDECIRPKGTDAGFVHKVKAIHNDQKCLVRHKLQRPWEFGIEHFAGTVMYDASGFVDINKDQLPKDLMALGCQCTNELISAPFHALLAEFQRKNSIVGKKRGGSKTLSAKFKLQLNDLMQSIDSARTRYIRCIKPNSEKKPYVTDHALTMKQLKSAGLVTAITISRETFPNHMAYEMVWSRFRCLCSRIVEDRNGDDRKNTERLLKELFRGRDRVVGGYVMKPYACGKTKVFFRSGSLEVLESDRVIIYDQKAILIQRCARRYIERMRYQETMRRVIQLQSLVRWKPKEKSFHTLRRSTLALQCWYRFVQAKKQVGQMRLNKVVTVLQSSWRSIEPRKLLLEKRNAAIRIQQAIRTRKNKFNFTESLAVCVEEARKDHQMKKLMKRLSPSSELVHEEEKDEILSESEMMIRYLAGQLYMQRGRVSELKAMLTKEREELSQQRAHTQSVEAALSASKIEVSNLKKSKKRSERRLADAKGEMANLRSAMRDLNDDHSVTTNKREIQFREKEHKLISEIGRLKRDLRSNESAYSVEVSNLKTKLEVADDVHRMEVSTLNKKLQVMQDSYDDDMSRMLSAIENSSVIDDVSTVTGYTGSDYMRTSSLSVGGRGGVDVQEEMDELRRTIRIMQNNHEAELRELKREMDTKCERCLSRRQENRKLNLYQSSSSVDLGQSFASMESF